MFTYTLEQTRTEPLYLQIYQAIRQDIETGTIKAGEKLPSKRILAEQLGVSVITAENAYSQLIAEGYVRAVPKKGYFAEKIMQLPVSGSVPELVPCPEKQTTSRSEQTLFPFTVWAKLMREELASDQQRLLTRTPCEGAYALRKAIADYLKRFRNMQVMPEQIVIGAGTEYLYMLIHILLGDAVFGVEEPGYSRITDVYSGLGLPCRRIPMLEDGIDLSALQNSGADIMHISPSHHFPTGVITSIGKRYALLGWAAEQKHRYIIEDDYDSEFRLSGKPVPSLFSIDVTDKVIYMNTFSKSLTPTIRISYMILPLSLSERFQQKIGKYACTVSTFEQYTLTRFIQDGYFEKHIHRMRKYYKDRRAVLFSRMKAHPLFDHAVISGENAGLHCLVRFDTALSDEALLEQVHALGFHADALKDYYQQKPEQELHTLLFYY